MPSGAFAFLELMRPILRLPPPPSSYSTEFDLTENPISESGIWRVGSFTGYYQDPRTSGGTCYGSSTSAEYNDCIAHLAPGKHAVPVNHRVGGRVFYAGGYTPPDSHEIGLYLRMLIGMGAGGNKVRGYECLFPYDGTSFQIIRWEGTVNNDLANFSVLTHTNLGGGLNGLAEADLIEAQIIGTQIRCYKNGTEFANVVDTTWSDGNPGMGYFIRPGGTPSSLCLKNWFAQGA